MLAAKDEELKNTHYVHAHDHGILIKDWSLLLQNMIRCSDIELQVCLHEQVREEAIVEFWARVEDEVAVIGIIFVLVLSHNVADGVNVHVLVPNSLDKQTEVCIFVRKKNNHELHVLHFTEPFLAVRWLYSS